MSRIVFPREWGASLLATVLELLAPLPFRGNIRFIVYTSLVLSVFGDLLTEATLNT